jgi:acyl-coenzyme A thioesterase PaaI-like protein
LMASDISLSSAIRLTVGKEAKLPTVSLQIDYTTTPIPTEPLLCSSTLRYAIGDLITAECHLKTESGGSVGRALGRFLLTAREPGQGFSCFPWENPPHSTPTLSELTATEHQVYSFLSKESTQADAGVYDQLYGVTAADCSQRGTAQLRQPLGPHLANRSGVVQGGAIAGLLSEACQAAARSREPSLTQILSSSCTFLRAAAVDSEFLNATATTLFIGRRVACVSAEATDDRNVLVARAEALFSTQDSRSERLI